MAKPVKLVDAVNGYLLSRKSKCVDKTIEWYRQKLAYFCMVAEQEWNIVTLRDITVTHLRLFVEHVKATEADANNPHKPTRTGVLVRDVTVKGYVQVIKGFFNWCEREELIKKNPAAKLDNPKVGRYVIKTFTQDQIRALLGSCDTATAVGYRDYTIMLLLLDTGIRAAELCGLTLDNVYLAVMDEAFIKVMGKGRKEREIGLSPEVARCLWKYIHVYRKSEKGGDKTLFINRFGEPLTPNGVAQLVAEAAKRAKVTGVRVSPHTFRHTFSRMFMENGGDIYKLSLLLGHSSVVVTENYLKDFYSRSARQGQAKHSPVTNMGVGRPLRGFRKGPSDTLGR
jgi:site-specific recombinase XerD